MRGEEARQAVVPVLQWRVVADPPPGSPRPQLYTAPDAFAAQLAALSDQGFRAITLAQLFAAWDTGAAIPRQPVVLTFDDGYPSQGRIVAPALKARGWPGVLNLVPANVGGDGLPLSRLKEMVAAGWEIDAKAGEETDLTVLDPATQVPELQRIADEVEALPARRPSPSRTAEGSDQELARRRRGRAASRAQRPGSPASPGPRTATACAGSTRRAPGTTPAPCWRRSSPTRAAPRPARCPRNDRFSQAAAGSGTGVRPPSWPMLGSHSSQRGRYQFQSPRSFIVAGQQHRADDRRVDEDRRGEADAHHA